jgi:hypothetical protein
MVRRADYIEVVFNDYDRVSQVTQLAQYFDETARISLVQANCRLVEHVHHAGQVGTQERCQP